MPHKHKRQKTSDLFSYDLPPTSFAKALPTKPYSKPTTSTLKRSSLKRTVKRSRNADDTPRAFARLLAFQEGHKLRSGLDDGSSRKKTKNSTSESALGTTSAASHSTTSLQRLPHESMSAFSQRVNASLPISGLAKSRPDGSGLPSVKGLKADGSKQTRMEKRMQNMQREWREAKKRRDDAMKEDIEEEEEERSGSSGKKDREEEVLMGSTSKNAKKRRRGENKDGDDDDDPWAELNARKRASATAALSTDPHRGLIGLHDVVAAPPKLSAPRAIFRDTARDVPKAAGSLHRREELAKVRAATLSAMRQRGRSLKPHEAENRIGLR